MQTNLSQYFITSLITLGLTLALTGCNGSSDSSVDTVDTIESSDSATETDSGDSSDEDDTGTGILHSAYYEFDTDHVEVVLNGDTVSIETNGLPNHTSPYWSADHALFVEPTVTSYEQMAPGNIDEFVGTYTLTVDNTPEKSADTSATGLGAIGIAVSGSVIYNDEEGPGIALDGAVGS